MRICHECKRSEGLVIQKECCFAVVLLGNTHDIVLQFSKGMCKPCAEAAARAIDWQKELKL